MKILTFTEFEEVSRQLLGMPSTNWGQHLGAPDDDHQETLAFQLLFIWALLTQRWKLADLFWSYSPEPVHAAFAAGWMLREIASLLKGHIKYQSTRKTLKYQRREWADRAFKLLQACYEKDQVLTEKLVKCVSENWGEWTPLRMALDLKNYEFAGHSAVQSVASKAWTKDLKSPTWIMKIFLSTICPLLVTIPSFIEMEKEDSPTSQGRCNLWMNKLCAIYKSPVGKYCLNLIFYLVFLAIFSFILLAKWDSKGPTALEILTIIWVASIYFEDVHEMSNTTGGISLKQMNMWAVLRKFKYFVLKMAGCFLFAAGITLRYIPHNTNDIYPATFRWARVLLSIDISLFFMRGLEFFLISKTVGPKLTMISGMIHDVSAFVGVFVVFLFSYGIAVQAILFPFQEPSWQMLINVVYQPFFHIYGQLFLEHYEGEKDQCVMLEEIATNNTTNTNVTICPQREWFVWVLLVLYLLSCILVLLNLLIAIFNNTYSKIEENSRLLWKFQHLKVVTRFVYKPILPHPFKWVSWLFSSSQPNGKGFPVVILSTLCLYVCP
jgi:transient receptor potential cation channel subfamily M protein 3